MYVIEKNWNDLTGLEATKKLVSKIINSISFNFIWKSLL